MTEPAIEDLVAEYLERCEREAGLSIAAFTAEHPGRERQLADGIRAALEVRDLLAPNPDERPDRIGDWQVERELGRGGMGIVYAVHGKGRRCALKLLPFAASQGPKAMERFRREAAILSRLDHPNIVAVHETGTWNGSPYLVMERVDGQALAELGRVEPRRAAELVLALARAVAAAHQARVLHRDLKPQNVIVRADGQPVLLDFGLTAVADEASLTSTGEVLGTPRYMAPEAALGQRTDERTDVWGLGQILFQLITGRPAVEATGRAEILAAVGRARIPAARRSCPELPVDLETLLRVALARRPARRYPSATALADDLQRFLSGAPVRTRPPGALAHGVDLLIDHRRIAVPVLLLLATWLALPMLRNSARSEITTTRRQAELERALSHWIEGNTSAARRAIAELLANDAEDSVARALRASLDGAPAERLAALDGFERGDYASATRAFEELDEPAFAPLRARSLRLAGRSDDALDLLAALRADRPESWLIAAELADAYVALDRPAQAESEVRRGLVHAPDNRRLTELLAQLLLARGELRAGIEQAQQAAEIAVRVDGAPLTHLARILERAPDSNALQAVLRDLLAEDPERVDTRFALAMSLDTDHQVVPACREYQAVLEREPGHVPAHLNLGWLLCGANREHCQGCRDAFAAAPDLLDPARSVEYLARAVEIDRGRDENVLRNIEKIAIDKGLVPQMCAALEALVSAADRTASSRRIEDTLRRLRSSTGNER